MILYYGSTFLLTLAGLILLMCSYELKKLNHYSVIIQLLMTAVLNKEELFLDKCSDYCHKYIISKIKSIDLADDGE